MQMQIADCWLRDMPQQFLGKHNIEVLVKAFARQLQELQKVFDDLNTQLEPETAIGKNLDYVGTILPLTRKEAGELAGVGVTEPVISDERYRKYMKYKILRNTSECTYDDLVAGIELLWKYENIHYIEDSEHPAMIIFETSRLSLDEEDPIEFHANLCIRASGVGVLLRKIYGDSFSVNIKYSTAITFTTAFYPQFNLPELLLNGNWKLDGSKTLNGYDGSEHIDLYPVEIELQDKVKNVQKEKLGVCFLIETRRKIASNQEITIQTEAYPRFNLPEFGSDRKTDLYPVEIKIQVKAAGVLQEKPKIIFFTETKEKITNKPEIKVQVSTIHHGTAKEKITIQTEAEVKTRTGEIFMDNQNFLDGSWELDGSRTLNGGDYQW